MPNAPQHCACFAGTCRGGEVIDGKLANGQRCKAQMPSGHDRCKLCGRNTKRVNNDYAECSHCDCPHRCKAWSDRPPTYYAAPEDYSHPLDQLFDKES